MVSTIFIISAAGTTTMFSVMPKDLAMSLMSLSFSRLGWERVSFVVPVWVLDVGLGRRRG